MSTGRFWVCAQCRRHVPIRLDACLCGFDRTSVPSVRMREVSTAAPLARDEGKPFAWAPWTLVMLLLGWIGYLQIPAPVAASAPPRVAEVRAPAAIELPPMQMVQFIPAQQIPATNAEAGLPLEAPVAPPSTPQPTPPIVRVEVPQQEQLAQQPAQESDVERMRREGIVEFARSMGVLEHKADQADMAWQRYVEGCHLEVSTATAAAAVGGRSWFAIAYAQTTTFRPTDSCAEAGNFYSLVGQVHEGMCVAEDLARRAWVLPGTRRDIRLKHRLDWDGWDRICQQR